MNNLQAKAEAILFIATKPMSPKDLAEIMECTPEEAVQACEGLMQVYLERKSGLAIIKDQTTYQMVSAPDVSEVVKEFAKQEMNSELSRPSLETLTIIAYRGPIAKLELDRIRGINCSLILRNLLIKGLIESKNEKGETYYSVTTDFVKFLGLSSVSSLPEYQDLRQDKTIEKILNEEQAI